MELKFDVLDVDTYLDLRRQVGWKKLTRQQAEAALSHSLRTVLAVEDGHPLGMGRMVGDGAVIVYVQDLVVLPGVQGRGVGSAILRSLTDYARSIKLPDTELMLDLMCAKGRERFYIKNGFTARPTDNLGPGMIMYLK